MPLTIAGGDSLTIGPTESETIQRELTVSGELTVQGNITVNNVRELLATAADSDASQFSLTRVRSLQTSAVDVDSSTIVSTRIRELTAGRTLTVPSGQTLTVDTERTEHSATVAGELTVTGELTLNGVLNPAADADGATTALSQSRTLTATATDSDALNTALSRIRELITTASDIDIAQAVASRERTLIASASDPDSGITVFTPTSFATDSRTAIIELLDGFGNWPGETPLIKRVEETPPKQRENTLTPAIYVHKPTGDDINRFSAEGLAYTENETVELYIYILESDDETPAHRAAREYRNRVINGLSTYLNDNYTRTAFHSIETVNSTDARAQKTARKTDHFVYTVEVETFRLSQRL
jgi:hypothetical protein